MREAQRQKKAAMLDFARQYEKPRECPEDPTARQDLYELNGTVQETIQYVDNVIDYKKRATLDNYRKSRKACSPRTKKILAKNQQKARPNEII